MKRLKTDILILGSGGAGLFAALHAKAAAPDLIITIAVKGLLGKSGCTRMVQGGYNVALAPNDSVERHFMDTIQGGKWLNNQDLAWTLVTEAQVRIRELENEIGCFFDRNPDGTVHQKAFAGQTFDRTVHKGDLTGIEIINRLAEQIWARDIGQLEEHRAVAIIPTEDGEAVSGVLMIEMRTGAFVFVKAQAVLLATGGGPTMYTYHTPSGDKSCDGMAMALRVGLTLRDMEMVQFHPTGLLAGPATRMTGTVLEEGLRGAGGWLVGGDGERFMGKYDDKEERATRDIVSRAIFEEIRAGNFSPLGGVFLQMSHLGADMVRSKFKGMVERCADCGFDLVGGRVEVIPTAHYMMGGVIFDLDCATELTGLFAAGEDTGGVHGANRLGGNGVANSTVFGGIAGDKMANWVQAKGIFREADVMAMEVAMESCLPSSSNGGEDLETLRQRLNTTMWENAGIIRDATGLKRAAADLTELVEQIDTVSIPGDRAFSITWHEWLNLKNLVLVAQAITASAQARENSRGAHYRADFPEPGELAQSTYTCVRMDDKEFDVRAEPVRFPRVQPGQSLI